MQDKILRIVAKNAEFRAVIIWMPETAKTLFNQHKATTEMSSHLINSAMSSLLLAASLKGQGAVSLRVDSNGIIGIMNADGTPDGLVRAMISKANIEDEPLGKKLKLPIIGAGSFSITKTYSDSRKPYTGLIELGSTSIAKNTAAYLLGSEQIKSSVGISTIFNSKDTPKAAAFLIEALPKVLDEDIIKLEENLKQFGNLDSILKKTNNPEDILDIILKGFDTEILKEIPINIFCPCTESRVINAIKSTGKKGIKSMKSKGENLEVFCDYCRKQYIISPNLL